MQLKWTNTYWTSRCKVTHHRGSKVIKVTMMHAIKKLKIYQGERLFNYENETDIFCDRSADKVFLKFKTGIFYFFYVHISFFLIKIFFILYWSIVDLGLALWLRQ